MCVWGGAFPQPFHNCLIDLYVLKSCLLCFFLRSPQPHCWSVDATPPTSCWWVLGRREPTALFSSASGSWSRTCLKVMCSVLDRVEVLRPMRTLKRPLTVCASAICKKVKKKKKKCEGVFSMKSSLPQLKNQSVRSNSDPAVLAVRVLLFILTGQTVPKELLLPEDLLSRMTTFLLMNP